MEYERCMKVIEERIIVLEALFKMYLMNGNGDMYTHYGNLLAEVKALYETIKGVTNDTRDRV